MERVLERVLIVFPPYLEDVLWCLPVAQTYVMYGDWKLGRTSIVTVVCDEKFKKLVEPVLPHSKFCSSVSDLSEEELQSFDAVWAFDRERALRLGIGTKKTAIECYGIQCGSAPALLLPTMAQALVRDPLKIVFLQRSKLDYCGGEHYYPFKENRELFDKVFTGAHLVEVSSDATIEEAYLEISSATFCLGVVGGFTLMAAAMMKPLLEIYPESLMYREWAAKWASPFYRIIPAEIEQVPVEFLVATFDKFIASLMEKKGATCPISTDKGSTQLVKDNLTPTAVSL